MSERILQQIDLLSFDRLHLFIVVVVIIVTVDVVIAEVCLTLGIVYKYILVK